jgi:hypothetical protein
MLYEIGLLRLLLSSSAELLILNHGRVLGGTTNIMEIQQVDLFFTAQSEVRSRDTVLKTLVKAISAYYCVPKLS